MFYAQFVLSKKGPLAKIWLAAHWEKKLSKAQIYDTNVEEACGEIMRPKSKIALRTTGHLLLGIVKIYSRKTKYLLADCNEAFLKIKMAFRPGMGFDAEAAMPTVSIAMPDLFGDYEATLPDFNEIEYNIQPVSQSRIDEITLKEDIIIPDRAIMTGDFELDDFGEAAAGVTFDDFDKFGEEIERDLAREEAALKARQQDSESRDIRDPTPNLENAKAPGGSIFGDDDMDVGGGIDDDLLGHDDFHDDASSGIGPFGEKENSEGRRSVTTFSETTSIDTTTGHFNLETAESFYERQERKKKKRRLIIDEQKNISGDEMKANMSEFGDTLSTLDLAPPTKKLMQIRTHGSVEKMFHFPGCSTLRAKPLVRLYQSNLVLKQVPQEPENDKLRRELCMLEVREEEFQYYPEPVPMETGFDDFEEIANIDLEALDNNHSTPPPPMDMPDTPLSPQSKESNDGDVVSDSSPSEKQKRKKLGDASRDDEEQVDEADEHKWNKRTQGVLNSIAVKLRTTQQEEIALADLLTKGATRKTAAQKFYTMLVLKKWQAIDVSQAGPYADILISAGPNIDMTT